MRRLGFTLLLVALATGPTQAMQAKKPVKKSAAGQPAVRKATRPPASTSRKPAPALAATAKRSGRSAVDDAGNRAAESAASERVHAWMRDHHEVIADDAPVAKPVRKPAAATGTSTAAKASSAKDDAQKATTEDFLKAAEQRRSLEEKQPQETGDTPAPADDVRPSPKSEAAPPQPAPGKAVVAEDKPAPQPAAPAKSKLNLARPEPPKPSTQRTEPAKIVTAAAPPTAAPTAKPAIEEKAASELPAPPVLAVKRTELVEEDETIGSGKLPQPRLTFRRGRLVVPAPLLGSHAILVRQNVVADRYGLERVQDDNDLERMRKSKDLIALPDTKMMQVDDRLAVNRRYARPWAVKFLNDLGRAHYDHFHGALQVNSAVRTVEFQHRLIRTNGNAAPAEGDTASPHLTGQAVDIAKHGLSMTEIAWLRAYLLPLVQEGKIDVEEEFQQACFHISIYKNYMPEPKTKAKPKSRVPKALATAVP